MKISRNGFRLLLLLMIITAVAGEVTAGLTDSSLPSEVRAFVQSGSGSRIPRDAQLVIGISGAVIMAAELLGLAIFWKPARPLLVVLWGCGFLVSPWLGTNVESALAGAISSLSDILYGIVIALVYFSPAAEFFERPHNKKAEDDRRPVKQAA